ncbi:MAG: hypothetical protein HKN44_03515 [Ilumatobacter sp.]|nr:hypothetical protein [Ilumatobacter sp.]
MDSPGDAFSEDELARLALAADLDAPLADDAVPFGVEAEGADLLPEWYMPVPQASASTRSPRRVLAVSMIVGSLLVVNGVGLCVTYGFPEIAW